MSRAFGPTMVGNDMILGTPRPNVKRTSYSNTRRSYAFPNGYVENRHHKELPSLPNLFRYMLNATPTPGVNNSAPVYITPPVRQSAPRITIPKRKLHISKSMALASAACTALIIMAAVGLAYRQQILTTVKDVRLAAVHQPATPKPNPRQITIRNSDYNQAITALMTQSVTVNLANSSQSVGTNTLVGWLSVTKHAGLTNISVKFNQVLSYLNQIASGTNVNAGQVNAAANKIANNLLSANGVTVSL